MITYLNQKRGQSTMEFAILFIIVITALLSVQVYMKRGFQGGLVKASDDLGDQYSMGNTNVIEATKRKSHEQQTFGLAGQGVQETKLLSDEITNTVKKKAIINTLAEDMGH